MISLIAFRNIIYRPWRSVLLFFGYGVGVGVMIVLLSVGEALLTQARDEKLVGGGSITVLPQGLDVEVMKTGGVGGLFFSIDQARFIYDQLLASPRLASSVSATAPQIEGRLVYLRTMKGNEYSVRANGEIPSRTRAVRGPVGLESGEWKDDDGDRRWMTPTLAELRHDIDHFHVPPDSAANRDTWAEWHYFNVVSPDRKKWAFITLMVVGDVTSSKWGGSVLITTREEGKRSSRFVSQIPKEKVHFSTTSADLDLASSSVKVLPNGDYRVIATASGDDGPISVDIVVHPAARAYFPGASLGSEEFVSGYTVPGLRANASGSICVAGKCERYDGAQSYHDHNWGVWRGVTWDWGASRAGAYTILYGRVKAPGATREAPLFVYLVDSLGFRAVLRPASISYVDGRTANVGGREIRVPSRAVFADVRGADTLRVELNIEDAIATDTRAGSQRQDYGLPYFIQMKGIASVSGRIGGERISGSGTGFFETYR
jgi:hypothetical protein